MKNVLLTGALGTVGTAILDHLGDREEYEFTLLDREADADRDVHVADVADYEEIRPAFDDQDAVLHLAGQASPGADWPDVLRNNVVGTYNVLEAARGAGVDEVMFASTNHVVGMYRDEREADLRRGDLDLTVDHTDPVRPNSYYAVSKLFGEHLGRYYVENEAAPGRFYAIRIGWVLGPDRDTPYGPAEEGVEAGEYERGSEAYRSRAEHCRCQWCSRRDMARLTDCVLRDESVTFDVFYARSASPTGWLDIEHAREELGYDPADDVAAFDDPAA